MAKDTVVDKKSAQKNAAATKAPAKAKSAAKAASSPGATNAKANDLTAPDAPRKRGRPSTGNAKNATQRTKLLDEKLVSSGGRILNKLRLSKEANNSLDILMLAGKGDSVRAIVDYALRFAADNSLKRA